MRIRHTFTLVSLIAACGSSTPAPDASEDVGFNKPSAPLMANKEMGDKNWVELGPADLSCLNMPSADVATSVQVMVDTTVADFQSGNAVPSAMVTVFKDVDAAHPFDTQTSDTMAKLHFTVP